MAFAAEPALGPSAAQLSLHQLGSASSFGWLEPFVQKMEVLFLKICQGSQAAPSLHKLQRNAQQELRLHLFLKQLLLDPQLASGPGSAKEELVQILQKVLVLSSELPAGSLNLGCAPHR